MSHGRSGRMSHGRFRAHSDASDAPSRAPRSERAGSRVVRPIGIQYYHDAAMKSKWCRDAERSDDWQLQLQLFLDEPSSSRGALVFSSVVFVAIMLQVGTSC